MKILASRPVVWRIGCEGLHGKGHSNLLITCHYVVSVHCYREEWDLMEVDVYTTSSLPHRKLTEEKGVVKMDST